MQVQTPAIPAINFSGFSKEVLSKATELQEKVKQLYAKSDRENERVQIETDYELTVTYDTKNGLTPFKATLLFNTIHSATAHDAAYNHLYFSLTVFPNVNLFTLPAASYQNLEAYWALPIGTNQFLYVNPTHGINQPKELPFDFMAGFYIPFKPNDPNPISVMKLEEELIQFYTNAQTAQAKLATIFSVPKDQLPPLPSPPKPYPYKLPPLLIDNFPQLGKIAFERINDLSKVVGKASPEFLAGYKVRIKNNTLTAAPACIIEKTTEDDQITLTTGPVVVNPVPLTFMDQKWNFDYLISSRRVASKFEPKGGRRNWLAQFWPYYLGKNMSGSIYMNALNQLDSKQLSEQELADSAKKFYVLFCNS